MLIDNCGGILWFLLNFKNSVESIRYEGSFFTCGCNHRSTIWDMGSVMLLQLDTIGLISIWPSVSPIYNPSDVGGHQAQVIRSRGHTLSHVHILQYSVHPTTGTATSVGSIGTTCVGSTSMYSLWLDKCQHWNEKKNGKRSSAQATLLSSEQMEILAAQVTQIILKQLVAKANDQLNLHLSAQRHSQLWPANITFLFMKQNDWPTLSEDITLQAQVIKSRRARTQPHSHIIIQRSSNNRDCHQCGQYWYQPIWSALVHTAYSWMSANIGLVLQHQHMVGLPNGYQVSEFKTFYHSR